MKLLSSSFLALLVLAFAIPLFAGTNNSDDQIWVAGAVSHEIKPVFALELEQQFRYKDQYSTLDKTITQLALSVDVRKVFKLTLGYRYTNSGDEIIRRAQLAVSTSIKLNRWRFSYRQQYQAESESDEDLEYELRNKLGIRYLLWARLAAYAEYEWFHRIGDPPVELRKYRATTGLRVNLPGPQVLKIFIRRQQQVNRKNPDRQNILGLKYEYEL